jgi:hypothetical protein
MGVGGGEERMPSEGLGWPAMAEEPGRFEANKIYMGSRLEANATGRELERRRGARGYGGRRVLHWWSGGTVMVAGG